MRPAATLCLLLTAAGDAGLGQQPTPRQSDLVIRTETALIEVEVRVTDRKGKPVTDLERQDFTVLENGKGQEIGTFEFVPNRTRTSREASVEPSDPSRPAQSSPVEGPSPKTTWVYIASRVGELQRKDTHRAIKGFIETHLQPGMQVSLQGLPFTSDKRRLLDMVDKMLHQGGRDGIPSFVELATARIDEEVANLTAFTGVTSPVSLSTAPLMAHTQRVHLERTLIEGYTSLVNQLSVFPGKKILVLFSRGLRFDRENAVYLEQFEAAAMRGRVTLHAIDVRGLVAMVRGGAVSDSFKVESPTSDSAFGGLGLPAFLDPTLADKPFSPEDLRFSQQGLMSLAEATGGKAVVNDNDLGVVFRNVTEEMGGYYLLGYYPNDTSQQGRFRKLEVSINRPKLTLSFRRGYFEEKEFSEQTDADKRRALERLLYSNATHREIPLRAGYEFFRGENGRATVAYCVGIESRFIPAKTTKKGMQMELVMLMSAEPEDEFRLSVFDDQTVQLTLKPDEFKRMQADDSAMLQFPSTVSLAPGKYRWRIVVRDETGGKAGTFQSTVEVPDFQGTISPSSLLLTERMVTTSPDTDDEEAEEEARGIEIDRMRFHAQPTNVFRRGGSIYMVYGLYNVPDELLQSPPAPRVFLLLGEKQIDRPPFRSYEVFPSKERKQLHYVSTLDTSALEPGAYKLVVPLPDGQNAIFRDFTVKK